MFLTPISLQNSTNTSSSTLKTKHLREYSNNVTSHLQFAKYIHLTWFIRSRRSLISLSRDWMILLMSLMRGPKLANSLSNLDFSWETKTSKLKYYSTNQQHRGKRWCVWPDCTCMLRDRWRVFVCSRSLWEYLSLIWRPWAWDWTWRNSASFLLAFICSYKADGQQKNVLVGSRFQAAWFKQCITLSSSVSFSFFSFSLSTAFSSQRLALAFKSLAPPEMTPDFWNRVPSRATVWKQRERGQFNIQSFHLPAMKMF